MNSAMKALTVGGAMIDTIAIIESDRIERVTMRNAETAFLLLEEGRKTEALEVSNHCGGGAINTAVALGRLGLDVAALVKLGKDARAETVLLRLAEEGVSQRWVLRDGRAATGASVIISSHDRNAAIFTFRGANTLLEPDDLRDGAFEVDLVYIAGLSNRSAECFPLLIEKARSKGAMVATNPGIRQLTARGGAFFDCLGAIDILIVNRREADALVPALVARFGEGGPTLPLEPGESPPGLIARGFFSGGFEISLAAFAAAFAALGPKYIVVTDGAEGAYVAHAGQLVFCPVLKSEAVGTAGAGDAFGATFAGSVALGQPLTRALRAAAVNAASVIGHVDTQTGLLAADDISARTEAMADDLPLRVWSLSAASVEASG